MADQSTSAPVQWPIVHVDLETSLTRQDVQHVAGAGAFIVYWRDNRPVGQWIVAPVPTMPDQRAIIARGLGIAVPAAGVSKGAGEPLSLSVLIPTRDRPDDLARCLASFRGQSRAADEIIVIDNSSTGSARAVVETNPGVRYVHEPRKGLDYARNAGVRAATSDLVAFCDDDVALHAAWTERMALAFDAPEIEAVTGLVLPIELRTEAQRLFEFKWPFGRGFARIDYGPEFMTRNSMLGCPASDIGAGASMAFRRSVFARLGMFDLRLGAGASGCSDDSEMWYRIIAAGGTCRYEPGIVSYHRHRSEMSALRGQIHDYVQGYVVSLLIQFQRFGHWGNLRRLFLRMPYLYARRATRIVLRIPRPDDVVFKDELRGYFDGLRYFYKHADSPDGVTQADGLAYRSE